MLRISVNCPSYKRPKVETLDYLNFCKIWVCETEYEDYIRHNKGFEDNIIKVPKGVQGNLCRIRNHILDKEFENNIDVVCIIDDDMKAMYKFNVNGRFGYEVEKIKVEDFMDFLQKYSLMCYEFGFKLWGVNCNNDRLSYHHYLPFSTKAYIGGPFSCHLKNDLRYDEKLPLKEDYDLTLQHLNKYRGTLRINSYHYDVKQSQQSGGCATYRNLDVELSQLELLQKKWGKSIVKLDISKRSNNLKKEKKNIDYNPIIRPPIRGV